MWYLQDQGKPLGPFTSDEIKSFLLQGRRGPQDLLWSEQAKDWKPAIEWPEFRAVPYPSHQGLDPDEGGEPQWVVLRWPEKDTHGPYTKAELRELSHKGALKPTDYVWKPGLTAWCRGVDRPDLSELFL